MLQNKMKTGIVLGLLAAVCYGFIPLFTKPLQDATGAAPMYPSTILLYRFGIAALVVGAIMLLRGISFRISYPEFLRLSFLALLSDGAAVFLIAGYPYMNSGVATTIHFMYPVMTAILMMTFFMNPVGSRRCWLWPWPYLAWGCSLGATRGRCKPSALCLS